MIRGDDRLEAKSLMRAAGRDINRTVPIDLPLYTESEFLAEEVQAKGETIYEKAGVT